MKPFPSAALKLRLTNVTADALGVPLVTWSRGNGLTPFTIGAAASGFPPTLLAAGDSVIEADMQYAHTSPMGMAVPARFTFRKGFHKKPRSSAAVVNTG